MIRKERTDDISPSSSSLLAGQRRRLVGAVVLPANLAIHEANREFGLDLPDGEAVSTVGGLCTERVGRIPQKGEHVRIDDYDIEIVEASNRRVKTVRIRRRPDADREDAAAAG